MIDAGFEVPAKISDKHSRSGKTFKRAQLAFRRCYVSKRARIAKEYGHAGKRRVRR